MQEVILHCHIHSNCECVTVSHLLGYIVQHPFQPAPSMHALVPMTCLHNSHSSSLVIVLASHCTEEGVDGSA